jgi:hypothetical protein
MSLFARQASPRLVEDDAGAAQAGGCKKRARPHRHSAGGIGSHRADSVAAIVSDHLGRGLEPRDPQGHGFVAVLSNEPQGGLAMRRRGPAGELRYVRQRDRPHYWGLSFGAPFFRWWSGHLQVGGHDARPMLTDDRFALDSGHGADMPEGPSGAMSGQQPRASLTASNSVTPSSVPCPKTATTGLPGSSRKQ